MSEPPILRPVQSRALGVTRRQLVLSTGGLTRVGVGAYADLSDASTVAAHKVRTRAALEHMRGVVASHTSAACLHGLPVPQRSLTRVEVARTPQRHGRGKTTPWVHIHHRAVPEADRVEVAGVPSTSVMRTVLDCPAVLDLDWAVAIADAALHMEAIDMDELRDRAARTRRIKGAAQIRSLPQNVSALAESPGESLLRMRLLRMRFTPVEQVPLPHVWGNPRVDFLIDDWLVVEFDGVSKYLIDGDPSEAIRKEKRRDAALVAAGFEVAHVLWDDLWDEVELGHRIRLALRRAQRRHGRRVLV